MTHNGRARKRWWQPLGPKTDVQFTRRYSAVEGTASNLRRLILALRERQMKTAFSFARNCAYGINYLEIEMKTPFSF
jgi:hypothetical protein